MSITTIETWSDLDLKNHVFLNLVDEINQVITPLITYFGLDSFNFHKTYNDDSQIRLSNTPNWYHYYLTNKLYQQSIFELPAYHYSKTRLIWSNIDTHNVILKEASQFGIKYGITLVEPVSDGCEFYFLGTTSNDQTVINKYLSNFHLLEKFITNFKNSGKQLLSLAEQHKIIAHDWQLNKLTFTPIHNIERIAFLASIYGFEFTSRELECVPLLLKGLSSKQIAERLKISFRTVEVYIENLKRKTGTYNKKELIYLLDEKFN